MQKFLVYILIGMAMSLATPDQLTAGQASGQQTPTEQTSPTGQPTPTVQPTPPPDKPTPPSEQIPPGEQAPSTQGKDNKSSEEDQFFNEPNVIVPPEQQQQVEKNVQQQMEQQTVNFTGNLGAAFNYNLARDFVFGEKGFAANSYNSSLSGDLLLDIRLLQGIKAFGDLGVAYTPANFVAFSPFTGAEPIINEPAANTTNLFQTLLKELFLDANINHVVFLRAGKQVLIWGRGVFWNPTDLLNRQRRNFFNLNFLREGIYGLKLQIPYGTAFNLYGFIDATDASQVSDFAVAGRAEFLFYETALALSSWYKDGFKPVYGLDFSTHLLRTEFYGELGLSYGDNRLKLDPVTGKSFEVENQWVPRFTLGLTRSFELLHVPDRLQITGEFYYNGSGYTDNMFDIKNPKILQEFVTRFYEPNEYGRYYGAVFINISQFLLHTMSLHLNAIGNFSDLSFTGITGVSYQPVDNFTLTLDLISFWGAKNREYTVSGDALTGSVMVTINF